MDYYNKQWYKQDKKDVSNNYFNYVTPTFQALDPRMKFPSNQFSPDVAANSSLQNKSDDELWVETWLSKIGKIHINLDGTMEFKSADSSKRPAIKGITKISDAKNSLAKWFLVLEKIQSAQEDLKSNVSTMTTGEWKKKTVEIGTLKDELTALMSQFENVEALKLLQRKINNRRKKRVNQKKQKKHLQEMKKLENEERKGNDKEIDQWLENMKESVEKVKMVRIAIIIIIINQLLLVYFLGRKNEKGCRLCACRSNKEKIRSSQTAFFNFITSKIEDCTRKIRSTTRRKNILFQLFRIHRHNRKINKNLGKFPSGIHKRRTGFEIDVGTKCCRRFKHCQISERKENCTGMGGYSLWAEKNTFFGLLGFD